VVDERVHLAQVACQSRVAREPRLDCRLLAGDRDRLRCREYELLDEVARFRILTATARGFLLGDGQGDVRRGVGGGLCGSVVTRFMYGGGEKGSGRSRGRPNRGYPREPIHSPRSQ